MSRSVALSNFSSFLTGSWHNRVNHKVYRVMQDPHKSGFTLIELSIVLVIIGLLVGGILTGQDLIKAAAQRAQISQIEKYNVAVNTFRGKYGGLPGDLAAPLATQFGFSVSTCDGSTGKRDGNGLIDGYYGPGNTWILQGEMETNLFWEDLSTANLIDVTIPNSGAADKGCGELIAPLTLTSGSNYIGDWFPTAKIGQSNFIYVYDGSHPSDSSAGGQNWYGISTITSVLANGGMSGTSPALTVMQAYNIDKKIDDGIPNSGSVQADYLGLWSVFQANPQASDSATSCYNTTTNTYSIGINSGNGLNCALSFKFQ